MSGANFNITTLTALNVNAGGGKYVYRGDPATADFAIGALTIDSAWHTLDLSSIVPVGASAVHLAVSMSGNDSTVYNVLFKHGDASNNLVRFGTAVAAGATQYSDGIVCPINADREIQYLATGGAGMDALNITVAGWFLPTVTEWTAWTPVSTWVANATHTGKYRLVNGVMEGYFKIALTGAPTAGTSLVIDLPSGYTLDTSVITNDQNRRLGDLTIYDAAPGLYFGCTRIYSGTEIVCAVFRADTTFQQVYSVQAITPITFANGDSVYGEFRIPVVAV